MLDNTSKIEQCAKNIVTCIRAFIGSDKTEMDETSRQSIYELIRLVLKKLGV